MNRTEVISIFVELLDASVTASIDDRDVIKLTFIPVAEGINSNGDEFLRRELQKSVQTFVGKPIVVKYKDIENAIPAGHVDTKIVGAILEAEGREDTDGRYKVFCQGAIYAKRFPQETRAILKQYLEKRLFFSMETHFTGTKSTPTSRQLLGLTFTGAAIVDRPAEQAAICLSVGAEGELEKKGGNTMELETLKAELAALKSENDLLLAKNANFKDEIKTLKTANAELETKISTTDENASNVGKLTAKLEVAEAKIAELQPIAEKVAELQSELDKRDKVEAEHKADEQAETRIIQVEKYLKLSPEDRDARKQRYRDMSEEAFAEVIASLDSLAKQVTTDDGLGHIAPLSKTSNRNVRSRYESIWE